MRRFGADFDEIAIPLHREDSSARLRACSPAGEVRSSFDGEIAVRESLSIGERLAERFEGADRSAAPETPPLRATNFTLEKL